MFEEVLEEHPEKVKHSKNARKLCTNFLNINVSSFRIYRTAILYMEWYYFPLNLFLWEVKGEPLHQAFSYGWRMRSLFIQIF